ncbi:MAG: hypothetical protein ISR65_16195 [Bacteriovoracaceae bacterium]|nr:hypothetical protein [Bacteriovoracaceae bacterium]
MLSKKVGGIGLKGGRRDQFYFCLLEYFPKDHRLFLRAVLNMPDETAADGNEAIKNWIEQFQLKKLVVDFPLTMPECFGCTLDCPGSTLCPKPSIKQVGKKIDALLQEHKNSSSKLLSRSLTRRLKKGLLPYWNRPLDFWIWSKYYDQLMELFSISYDSFGTTSLMLLSRYTYLKKHFPSTLSIYEGNIYLCMMQLLEAKIITKQNLQDFNHYIKGVESRLDIVMKLEKHLNLFIYKHDLEIIVKNRVAFDAFLMATIGFHQVVKKVKPIPKWASSKDLKFLIPDFGN